MTARIGFNRNVPEGGYAWWHLDAISDEGSDALTMTAFIGSAFSPYCAGAIRRGRGDPEDFASLALALHRPSGTLRTMTERKRRHVARDAATLAIGPSRLDWEGGMLEARIDEIVAPVPRRCAVGSA